MSLYFNNCELCLQIPVLVLVYNRPSVTRCLDLILKHRYNVTAKFPVVVSQDGNHLETSNAIQSYGNKVNIMIRHEKTQSF